MALIRTSELGSNNHIQIPDFVSQNIVFEHRYDGDSVHWHFDVERNIGVVSSEELDEFVHIRRSQVQNRGSNILVVQELIDEMPQLSEGSRVGIYFRQGQDETDYLFFFPEERFFNELDELGKLLD